MLWIEIAPGADPVIYRAKKRRFLVSPKHLLKSYMFRSRAHALRMLKRFPDHYEFADVLQVALREIVTIPEVHHVQRKKERRRVRLSIESQAFEKRRLHNDRH